jgi:hypothetical protein
MAMYVRLTAAINTLDSDMQTPAIRTWLQFSVKQALQAKGGSLSVASVTAKSAAAARLSTKVVASKGCELFS